VSQDAPIAAYEVTRPLSSSPQTSARRRAALNALKTTLVPSRFNVGVDIADDRVAVYNTFSTALTVLPRTAWQRLLAPGRRIEISAAAMPHAVRQLHGEGFFCAEGTDEIELVRQQFQRARHDPVSGFMVNVLLTMGCNLSCPYCFQGKIQDETKPRLMAPETEDAIVAYLKKSVAGMRSLTVSWFGGEPLLGLRTIKRMSPKLTEFCDTAGIAYNAVITTNGVLLDRDAVDALAAARVSQVQVSLDIPAALRNDKRGRDTQARVLDNLVYAAERIPVQIRINFMRDDEGEWERLFNGMAARGLQHTLGSMVIMQVYQPESGRSANVGSTETPETYVAVMKRERERAKTLGLPMDRFVANSPASGCAATSDTAISIDPEGLIYRCPDDAGRPDRAYGSIYVDTVLKPENLQPWQSYDWFQFEECRSCSMLPQCAGGCPHQRMFQPGRPNETYCYWAMRGDLEGKVRETAQSLLSEQGAGPVLPASCGP
jgi:uncharacterized protein